MSKNDKKQNSKESKGKQKKSFLSGLIQVEESEKEEQPQNLVKESTQRKIESSDKEEVQRSTTPREKDGLTEEEKLLLNTGEGVNLIPKRSQAEISKEKKKFSFSITSILSLLVLILLSLGVVLFNIVSKKQLNSAKEKLYSREADLAGYTDKLISNEEILDRIDLYKQLQEGVFSPKEIIQYIMGVANRSGNVTIRNFEMGNSLDFEMSGNTTELSVVARLWYLLGIDSNVETVNLNSVGKSTQGVSFSFEGQLNRDKFVGK